jgi:D-glycero-alpha-D-manno-heptose-7-phosphate kinase
MGFERKPVRVINSAAPIRICDNGGWTDTWFAKYGKIFNIGVQPFVEVQIDVYLPESNKTCIIINALNYRERYTVDSDKRWGRHPLLEASIEYVQVPKDLSIEVTIYSRAPGGASTGTSAAVTVALIGALDHLNKGSMTPHEIAYAAQKVETDLLGGQCGIQDQLCSAYGGINYIEMTDYPYATVTPVQIPDPHWWELNRRLLLIYLGKSHQSSPVHEMVIQSLEQADPSNQHLEDLRRTAERSRDSLLAGDFKAFGEAMRENTMAQKRLHPKLVSADAERIIDIAEEHHALGWKVNGAGGDGGSVTLLCDSSVGRKHAMVQAIEQENPTYKNIPMSLSHHGLRVWEQDDQL